MFLYTATADTRSVIQCSEGELVWVPKSGIQDLNLWEGDKIFFRLLEEEREMFSLKLNYEEDTLVSAVLDGIPLVY